MPVRATKRGADRTPLSGDFDVLICGASFAGLAVARELRSTRRARPRARPLRDRRAPDVRLRRADGVAAQPRAARLRPPDLRLAPRPHPARGGPLAAAVDVLHLRLPGAVRAAVGAARRRHEFETAKVEGLAAAAMTVLTDRGEVRAPLIVDALGWRRVLGAGQNIQPPEARLSRGLEVHPGGARRGPRAVDRQAADPRGLRLVVPRRRRVARRRRVVRPARPRQGADGGAGRRPRAAAARLPGQLDPAPAAPGDRGRGLLRRRLRRPLPAAHRRGHPHRVLLRHRAGAGAARGARGPGDAGGGARPLPPVLGGARPEVRGHAPGAARRAPAVARARWAPSRARSRARLCPTGASGTTCASRRPRPRCPHPRVPRARPGPPRWRPNRCATGGRRRRSRDRPRTRGRRRTTRTP